MESLWKALICANNESLLNTKRCKEQKQNITVMANGHYKYTGVSGSV